MLSRGRMSYTQPEADALPAIVEDLGRYAEGCGSSGAA
jgi:hypothetical protein